MTQEWSKGNKNDQTWLRDQTVIQSVCIIDATEWIVSNSPSVLRVCVWSASVRACVRA